MPFGEAATTLAIQSPWEDTDLELTASHREALDARARSIHVGEPATM